MLKLEPTVRRLAALARRPVGTNAVIAGVCLAAVVLVWIAVVGQARFERREAIAAAFERNANLAVAFEEFTVRTIDGADNVARYVKREFARAGPGIDIPGLIADHTIDAAAFTAISIVDEHGNLVATSFTRVPEGPLNAADRPHFTVHIAKDTEKVFVSQPILSRLAGRATIRSRGGSTGRRLVQQHRRSRSSPPASPSSTATRHSVRATSSPSSGSMGSPARAGPARTAPPAKVSRADAS